MESESQTRFFELVTLYPAIACFWDREARECRMTSADLNGMSHGEKVMANFFMAIWFHKNRDFSLIEAAMVLDEPHRKVIAAWLRDPFWA